MPRQPAVPCADGEEPNPPTDPEAEKRICQARLERVRCELEVERLLREEKERAEAKPARERTVERWRQEEAQRRRERHDRRAAFWEKRRERQDAVGGVSGTLNVLLTLGLPPLVALLVYAIASSGKTGEILAVGSLTAASAFAVGALLGFLFGIPRTVAAASGATTGQAGTGSAPANTADAHRFAANTNLEQISDWLTKILVGVGLVQIHAVSGAVEDLADGLAPGLGSQGFSVAVALLVSFSITGFVSAYLFTRLRLQGAFEVAGALKQVAKAHDENAAIALVQQQLTPGPDKPTLSALTKALEKAPVEIRTQAFFMARRQRLENWSGEGSEAEEREFGGLSIPVFEALVACDTEREYYRSRAELGYALLEQSPPQATAAKARLDEAIELRPPTLINRTPLYELNRAYAEIVRDPASPAGRPASPEVADAVRKDLAAVVEWLGPVERSKYAVIDKWLAVNSAGTDPENLAAQELRKRFQENARPS
ncbi:MAG TPA: hypothetical protein VFU11_06370 [Solirubrobacterales bacterium]|nr:hypothetical protein [Solirubrobacterales bacterium]